MSYSLNIQAPTKAAAKAALAAEIDRLAAQAVDVKALIDTQIDSLPNDDERDVAINLGSQLHEGSATSSLNLSVNLVQRPR